jgi:hypothetical protein
MEPVQPKPDDKSIAPTTTAEENLRTENQRRVNLIWELTQAFIALLITGSTIYGVLHHIDSILLGNAFVLVIALYFVRTNHTKMGGPDSGSRDSRS